MTASCAELRAHSQKVTVAMSDLATLEQDILAQIAAASDEAALEAVRVAALGKKGSISALLATLGKMSPDERKTQGAAINLAKDKVTQSLAERRDVLKSAALDARLDALNARIAKQIATIPPANRNMIVFHNAWLYYNQRYGLRTLGAIEEVPGSEPSAGHLAQLIDAARAAHVRAIFAEPEYNAKLVNAVARSAGIPHVAAGIGCLLGGWFSSYLLRRTRPFTALIRSPRDGCCARRFFVRRACRILCFCWRM